MQRPQCDWCNDSGFLTAYHDLYDGTEHTIYMDVRTHSGEVKNTRFPGTLAVHCNCKAGQEKRARLDEGTRKRIFTHADVVGRRIPYTLHRKGELEQVELTEEAKRFFAVKGKSFLKGAKDA